MGARSLITSSFVMIKPKPTPSQQSGRPSAAWRKRERRKRTMKRRRKVLPRQRQRRKTRMRMTMTMKKIKRKLRKCEQVIFCNPLYSPGLYLVVGSLVDAFLRAPAEQGSLTGALRAIVPQTTRLAAIA